MKNTDQLEKELLASFENNELISLSPAAEERNKFKAYAEATLVKDRRVNIRLTTPDLMDLQAKAVEEGMPYQTLIASVLHKYVTGRLHETPSLLTSHTTRQAKKQAAG